MNITMLATAVASSISVSPRTRVAIIAGGIALDAVLAIMQTIAEHSRAPKTLTVSPRVDGV